MNRQLADNEDRRKSLHDFKKKSAEQRKILLIFGGFYGKTAENATFFEIF